MGLNKGNNNNHHMVDISICMITYNHSLFIEKAIMAVLSQKTSYTVELVIGEDKSTDNTRQLCEKYAALYPGKIRLLPSDRNYGMAGNFIRTLSACTGKYVAMCEGDDYWIDDNKLQVQADFLESHKEYAFSFHDVYNLEGKKKQRSGKWDAPDTSDLRYLLSHKGYITTLSVLMRNDPSIIELVEKVAAAPYLDLFVYVAAARKGLIKFFPQRMGVYRYHGDGVWSSLGFRKALEKTIIGYRILFSNLSDTEREWLKVRYLSTLEDYFLNSNAEDHEADASWLIVPEMNIGSGVIDYIRQSCTERKKVAHYVKTVPLNTLVKASVQKLKNKI